MISATKIKRKRTGAQRKRKKERKEAETHIKKFFSKLPIKSLFFFFPFLETVKEEMSGRRSVCECVRACVERVER
jgi:hypothetical protein